MPFSREELVEGANTVISIERVGTHKLWKAPISGWVIRLIYEQLGTIRGLGVDVIAHLCQMLNCHS